MSMQKLSPPNQLSIVPTRSISIYISLCISCKNSRMPPLEWIHLKNKFQIYKSI